MSRLARAEKMEERIKICRIVTRLNIGGPARQAVFLSRALNGDRYDTCLVTGVPEAGEGDMGYLAAQHGLQRYVVPQLRRPLHPWRDLRAFWGVWRLLRREQPLILHTHTAKAGALGRCAGWLYNLTGRMRHRHRPRLVMVHTFHGHVLAGYFGTMTTKLFTWIERQLARVTDRIVVVSEAAKQDLVARRIGQPERITVIPLGFDLRALLNAEQRQGMFRAAHRLEGLPLVGFVGRLVPIKQPGLLLRAAARLKAQAPIPAGRVRYVFVGDGELRASLEELARSLGLACEVLFLGWQRDLVEVYADLDVVCLTSLNEGLPAALIEAMAAGKPVVATDVGGVRELLGATPPQARTTGVPPAEFEVADRGILVGPSDAAGFAKALACVLEQAELRRRLGAAGRAYVRERFTEDRLRLDVERLYQELMRESNEGGRVAFNSGAGR